MLRSVFSKVKNEAGEITPYSRAGKRLKRIDEINEVAATVFVRDGYAAFSARKVAKELGISLNNLQHYCGSTENLCIQMLKAKLEFFVHQVDLLVEHASVETPMERLAVAIRENSAATFDTETARFFFQMSALASHDPAIKALMVSQYDRFIEGFRQLISAVNPQLPIFQVQIYAALIATQIDGNFFYQDQVDPGMREQLIETAIAFWSMTLKPVPGQNQGA